MLRDLYFSNFGSFKESCEISFVASPLKTEINPDGNIYAMGIKGGNGSGKTTILKAISFLTVFAQRSYGVEKDDDTPISTFFSNQDDSDFLAEFESDDVLYFYELSINTTRVTHEKLLVKKPGEKKQVVFAREYTPKVGSKITQASRECKELKGLKLTDNASLLTHLQFVSFESNMETLEKFGEMLRDVRGNVSGVFGMHESDTEIVNDDFISGVYKNSPAVFQFAKELLLKADLGIDDIQIRPGLDAEGKEKFFPVFIYEYLGKRNELRLYQQSAGTKALYRQLFLYSWALIKGGIFVLDEMDKHIHSHLLPKLLELFTSSELNPNKAQIIFTSHNTEIIDELGKYRTVLVSKEDKESYAYRLDEIPGNLVRNDRKISPLYLAGKIGGVPKLWE